MLFRNYTEEEKKIIDGLKKKNKDMEIMRFKKKVDYIEQLSLEIERFEDEIEYAITLNDYDSHSVSENTIEQKKGTVRRLKREMQKEKRELLVYKNLLTKD